MGAILRLNKMPENCRECPLADENKHMCRVRNLKIIAYSERSNRMPLCPLVNEGKYLLDNKEQLR
ncbi:MAG: hypothetical protein IJT99_01340 [Clostridia bacterium]|nr:hypothetical protein [Clostridia bacterium]